MSDPRAFGAAGPMEMFRAARGPDQWVQGAVRLNLKLSE
ncbi:hypothetical protein AEGHOMDF_3101 [Methylobacterium soli]|nr:hypothetical protein AEGHOMDF_3101 [Methylobacterium soli]